MTKTIKRKINWIYNHSYLEKTFLITLDNYNLNIIINNIKNGIEYGKIV